MRHNIRPTEAERKREYRMFQKVERGEKLQGDLAEDLDKKGAVGEIRREREAWAEEHGQDK